MHVRHDVRRTTYLDLPLCSTPADESPFFDHDMPTMRSSSSSSCEGLPRVVGLNWEGSVESNEVMTFHIIIIIIMKGSCNAIALLVLVTLSFHINNAISRYGFDTEAG